MKKAKNPRAKRPARRPAAAHPPYIDMVVTAITAMKERGGSSRQAIEKYIKANNKITGDPSSHLKVALKRGVQTGKLIHTKGTGASGSFKVGKAPAAPKKKPAKRVVAKKSKKKAGTPKKRTTKKTTAKKATKKKKTPAKKGKSPAKKKTAAKKSTAKTAAKKKTKSPKKRVTPKKKTAKKTKAKAKK